MAKKKSTTTSSKKGPLHNLLNVTQVLNDNKVFAGIIMLIMNIGSKYINIEFSKTQENYIKYSLGRQLIIFSILWVGTRDIFISLIMTVIFILFTDYLFNENSYYCIMSKKYREGNTNMNENPVTEKEVNDAINVLKQARRQKDNKENKENDTIIENTLYKENFI
jgi:hypothetical protein